MVPGDLPLRCHSVDELREHRCKSARSVSLRHAELLRDLTQRPAAERLGDGIRGDRHVLAGGDPRVRLRTVARLLEFAQDPLQAAVLLQKLKRDQQQRILLRRARTGAGKRTAARLHSTEHAANQPIEYSHDSSSSRTSKRKSSTE